MPEVTLYAGPSTYGLPPGLLAAAPLRCLPPVRRGDIQRLCEGQAEPGVVLICDGVFQCEPAVSHAEIGHALDAGWQVWGVSSLGAIRAFELRERGMRGFGWVHALFQRLPGLADDELCLLHAPQEPWFPLSEPLVNLRYALAMQGAAMGLDAAAAAKLVAAARELWFGDRTEATLRGLMHEVAGLDTSRSAALWSWLTRHRVKTLDLAALLSRRPWLAAAPAAPAPAPASRPPASPHPHA